MKKLTSLQIMMLMSLALGSSQIYSRESREMAMQDDNEAIQFELEAAPSKEARDVLNDLAQMEPMVVERIAKETKDQNHINQIAKDEAKLAKDKAKVENPDKTLHKVNNFLMDANKEIENLNKKDVVNELDVARLAAEIANEQAKFERATAQYKAKHKHNHRHEQAIRDSLMKAEQGLKSLNNKSVNQASESMQAKKSKNKTLAKKKSKSKKNNDQPAMSSESNNSDEAVIQHGPPSYIVY